MRRNAAATLKDVAAEAGVTVMSASVVLNGANSTARVSEQTRARILDAAARLKYRRNAAAAGLSRSRMNSFAVLTNLDGNGINLYLLQVLNGVIAAAAERMQRVVLLSVSDWKVEESRILSYCDGRIDGMVLVGSSVGEGFSRVLGDCIPFVCLQSHRPVKGAWNIDVDNEQGAMAATRYLLDRGHRRIMHFAGDDWHCDAAMRVEGFRKAMQAAGLPPDDSTIVPGSFTTESGYERMAALLARMPIADLPTAILCANDAIAYGCMEAMAERGVHVPEDISLVGFDDTLSARISRPPLTTMRQPFPEMGRRAVDLLLEQIEGGVSSGEDAGAEEPRMVVFPVELIERESVGPPRSLEAVAIGGTR